MWVNLYKSANLVTACGTWPFELCMASDGCRLLGDFLPEHLIGNPKFLSTFRYVFSKMTFIMTFILTFIRSTKMHKNVICNFKTCLRDCLNAFLE